MNNKTILVTGASGKTGRAVIQAFLNNGFPIRAYIHDPSHADLFGNNVEVFLGDLTSTRELAHAMIGVRAVYHICPNMHPEEVTIGRRIILAAKNSAVKHIVYHSVLHPQIKEMPHHWNKMQVESLLFKSGLNYTILQPAAYMQNILQYRKTILEKKIYSVPYNGDTRIGMVNLDDVAEAAVAVIDNPLHHGGIYELGTEEALSQLEIAKQIGRVMHADIRFEELPRDSWITEMRKTGMSDYALATLIRMFEYYESFGFRGNETVLKAILGRSPTSMTHFIENNFNGYNAE